jgi:protein involved in polysaccharide export with SLBB domain
MVGPQTGSAVQPANLRYAPGDKIRVVVYGEESLTGEYEVDSNGFITLPLAGSVRASGLTKKPPEFCLAWVSVTSLRWLIWGLQP